MSVIAKIVERDVLVIGGAGAAFGKTAAQGVRREKAVDVYEDILIAGLLKKDNQVCGALGIDMYSGELVRFNAKAVVLATGGFQPFSLKNSNSDMTGDGIALGLRAGAWVVDMEFLLFIGTILEPVYAGGSILPFLLTFNRTALNPKKTDLDGGELFFPPDQKYKRSARRIVHKGNRHKNENNIPRPLRLKLTDNLGGDYLAMKN